MQRQTLIYRTQDGYEPYTEFVDSLKDRNGAARIRTRVTRAELGNLGDHRRVGGGVIELRIDFGPGYRIYAGLHGLSLIVLLCAGDKSDQAKDIRKAVRFWEDFKSDHESV